MDAHALLTSQGWRGKGHSLHPTSDSTGLSRPLLVSQKANNHGIGKKQHKTSDMWWMNAFDKSLQGLDTSEQGKVVQTVTSGGLDMVVKGGAKWVGGKGGLYASFVRGEGLGGTITPETDESGSGVKSRNRNEESLGKKRSRKEKNESVEERRKRKAAKRAERLQSASEDTADSETRVESKEKRKAKRDAEKALITQDAAAELDVHKMNLEETNGKAETREERKARKAAKKAATIQEAASEKEADKMEVDDAADKVETKEERRERKRQKKLLKEAEQKALEEVSSSKASKRKRRKD